MSAHNWPRDEDGFPHRRAARGILFDEEDRVLLVRGHDADNPERSWWFTVGGGIEDGESARQCASRELLEETGIHLEPELLIGPIAYRRAVFDFETVLARQDEEIFYARTHCKELSDTCWTEEEQRVIDEYRWWDIDDFEAQSRDCEFYPTRLIELLRICLAGWDGTTLVIE